MKLKWWWIILFVLLALPHAALAIAGWVWLYERGLVLIWLAVAAALALAGWPVLRAVRKASDLRRHEAVRPAESWSPAANRAWEKVTAISARVRGDPASLDTVEQGWDITLEILRTVAGELHPRSQQPELEMPVPHLLWVVELVARDLREAFSEYVPGAHIATLHDMVRLRRLSGLYSRLMTWYRIVSLGLNPAASLIRELRDAAAGKMVDGSTSEIRNWAIDFCIKKVGFYAIELYSGHMTLAGVNLTSYRSRTAQEDARRDEAQQQAQAAEPLRILVVGQVKAGKSSLVNAMFGELKAAVDVLPTTRRVNPYLLTRDGLPRATILDSAGYQEGPQSLQVLAELREEFLRCDLVLLVTSAAGAARQGDRSLLDELRRAGVTHPELPSPAVIVVLTHIDRLRPIAEWAPPYDLTNPPVPSKADNIRQAIETVAADLAVDSADVVPVCLKPGATYNVEDALVPAIVARLPEAQRSRFLRCLHSARDEQYWTQLWKQAKNAGRLLAEAGPRLFGAGRGGGL